MSDETTPVAQPQLPVPDNGVDPGLLLVKGKNGENKQYIKSLSHAVLTVVGKYGYANLKCVGASAINNALKSITIASGEAMKRGVDVWVKPSFQEATFGSRDAGDLAEKTAMMLHVRGK